MADPKALGKTFAEQLLARVPEDRRAAAAELLGSDDIALALGQREAELNQWHGELTEWHAAQAAKPTTLAPALQTPANTLPADLVRKADVESIVQQRLAAELDGAANYMDTAAKLTVGHFREFSTELDITDLRRDPQIKELGILGVYQKKYGPQIAEKRATEQATAQAAREAEIRADERRQMAKNGPGPYPVSTREPSTLDAIKPGEPVGTSADELSDEYYRITAGAPTH